MKEKLETALWFALRPAFWQHAAALGSRKLARDFDCPKTRALSTAWARQHAKPVSEVLSALNMLPKRQSVPNLSPSDLSDGFELAERSGVRMGGAGDLALLYASVKLLGARRVLETGVAYGWSSLAILAAQHDAGLSDTVLVSIDMPYPKMNNEPYVGIVVPDKYRTRWTLIREPDRNGIRKGLSRFRGEIDLCHYDSDKSWYGRRFAYPLLWNALRSGGIFISDDIQDNFYFKEFAERISVPFHVTESAGKFVGVLRKP